MVFYLFIILYLQSVFALKPDYLPAHVSNICPRGPLLFGFPLIVMGHSPFSESQDKEKAACEVLCHADYDRRWPLAGPGAWCGDSRGRSPGLGHGDRAGAGREEGDGGGEGAEGARQDSRGAAAARRLQSAQRARTARWVYATQRLVSVLEATNMGCLFFIFHPSVFNSSGTCSVCALITSLKWVGSN